MDFVRVTCLNGRLFLPPGDFERNVLEEGESVILPKVLSDRIFKEDIRTRKIIKEEPCEAPENRTKIYSDKINEPVEDIVISKPEDVLDQNAVTVRKILKEREFSEDDLKDLKKREKKGKKRKLVLDMIRKLLKKGIQQSSSGGGVSL